MNFDDVPLVQVVQFREVLGQAIHDAEHEAINSARVVHFWDDDSLHIPMVGAAGLRRGEASSDLSQLVQALFAAGFLGSVALLRPHRTEFLGQILQLRDRNAYQLSKAAFNEIATSPEVAEVLAITRRLRGDGSGSGSGSASGETASTAAALQEIRGLGHRSFVYMEALAGTWESRLQRMLRVGLIDLTPHGSTMADLAQRDEFAIIAGLLDAIRPSRPLATAIDAAALVSLIEMNAAARAGDGIYPRFFTSSPTLSRLYRSSSWFRQQLEFAVPSHHPTIAGSVWRSGRYYLLRAMFPALRLGGAGRHSDSDWDIGPSLADLQDLQADLSESIEMGEARVAQLLRKQFLRDGSRIADLIDDLWKSRMTRIWLSLRGTSYPERFIADLKFLLDLGKRDEVRSLSRELEQRIERELGAELDDYRVSVRMADTLSQAMSSFATARARGTLSLTVDLAAVRWGMEFDGDDERDHVRVGAGTSGGMQEVLRTFDLDTLRTSEFEACRSLAILLGLEEFDLADSLLDRLGNCGYGRAFELMAQVAAICSSRPQSDKETEFHVSYFQETWESLSDSEKDALALGFGYAVFQLWSRSSTGGAWGFSSPQRQRDLDPHEWASWAMMIVEERIDSFSALARPFAVNHLLYVSSRSRRPLKDMDYLLLDLERIGNVLDQYLFIDTVGFCILMSVVADIDLGHTVADLNGRLDRAEKLLRQATSLAPRDEEVRLHLALLDATRLKVVRGGK